MMKQRGNSKEASSNYLPSLEATTSRNFDVFLSFRGDTRDKFTSHLHERLTSVGIRVFKDDVEMVKGENINEALKTTINNSRICIPIFSNNYASSKACLQELSHMVLEHKSIIPIFYDVGANDVKLKTGLYKKALENHHREGKVGKEEIERWEKALLEVGKILGYSMVNKNEADEITKITGQVLNQLMDKHQNGANDIVEIDDEVEYVMKMLDLNSDGCHIIGLCGMGGIGKTTLAKVLFNRLSTNFKNCCTFIANVRESVQTQQLLMLQRQLYRDLIGRTFADSINNSNEAINKIKKGLENKKLLLVLDDVDDENVLKNFVSDHSQLANGSRIIITTRNKRVLDALKNDFVQRLSNDRALVKVYQVQQLDNDRAFRLFSKWAFKKDSPPDEFRRLSEKVISSLGGLPLALKVVGSLLLGRSKKAWKDLIERLKKTPDKEIQTSLMISYQDLHEEEKKIFLDIACYPGMLEKTGAYYMWKSCGWHPDLSIDSLINKSLVKVESRDTLWMHDVLKDFGRDIIRKKCKRNGRELKKFLQIDGGGGSFGRIPNEERKYVEMLQLKCWGQTITSNDLIGFENVRFLELKASKIEGNFEGLFPNVRWITTGYIDLFEVANFNPEKLVVLQLWHSNVQVLDFWWSQMKAHKLQVLEIANYSHVERAPSFRKFSSLEVLSLGEFSYLVNSIGDLKKLIRINIGRDSSLASLPQTISDAKDLEEIVLSGNGQIFKLPASVYNLENLSRLYVNRVQMGELEDSIGNLVSLFELDLSYTSIQVLPNAIGQLTQLKILRINGCQIREFPLTIGNLKKLEVLEAAGCENFEGDISSEIGMLSCLRILDFTDTPICRIQKLPSSLTHLLVDSATIDIEICSNSLLELINVIELKLCCKRGYNPFNVPHDQVYPKRLDFRWICRSSMLDKLSLDIPYVISAPESVDGLSRLKALSLTFAEFQDHLQLPSMLSSLKLYDCKFPGGILDVSNAKKKLRMLVISGCDMREIRVTEMDSLESLEINGLRNLSSLKLCNCKKLLQIDVLGRLESLTDLSIRDCPSLTYAASILQMGSLSSVELWNCGKLVHPVLFFGLDYLTHLSIKDLGINSLYLLACEKLESIEGLDGLGSLTDLSIRDCPSLINLPNLSTLVNLQSLTLLKLERLGCIEGLTQLRFLEVVNIVTCQSLELDPDDLYKLNNTRGVVIADCDKLPCLLKVPIQYIARYS